MSTPAERAREYFRAGKFEQSLIALDEALAGNAADAALWNNRGSVLAMLGRMEEAGASFERALNINPGFVGALGNRANTLLALHRYEDAAQDYEALLQLAPDFPYAPGNLLHCRLQCCDWRSFEQEKARLITDVRAGMRAASPLVASVLLDSPEDQLRAARILAQDKYSPVTPLWRGERYRHDRIRIAYVSADFHAHATATLLAGVIECHDRARFETIAISFGPDDESPMRARLKDGFEHFVDAAGKSDAGIANLLRERETDIAIDLKGYTANARPRIFARRAVPVQVSYLGYPGTLGASWMDYIIADRVAIPQTAQQFYDERVVYLPDSYQANDAKREIAAQAPARSEAGLPEHAFVFCCFNNSYKILPEIFLCWMSLLSAVEGSVLWLLDHNAAARRNLVLEAERSGVSASRLIFAPRVPPDEHLARHRLADLFLDTLPYNAHTTASDALWAGLPVLTCKGDTFAARVAASLLHAAGLPELVTHSLDEYEALGLRLARDPSALSAIRTRLGANRTTSPLFDTVRFTRHLEAAYTQMHEQAARGEPPAAFAVAPN